MTAHRERAVTQAFVTLAARLAGGYDVVDLLATLTADCARLLDVASAGLLLADSSGVLHVMAASSERTHELEVFQLQRAEGPCRDCSLGGVAVSEPDLTVERDRWPAFVPAALSAGFASVHAVPMRLRDSTLGALGLFGGSVGALNADDLLLGQALADVASVALVQDAATAPGAVSGQLQAALSSRVLLEQAKGILAQLGNLDMAAALAALRRYAGDHDQRLTEVAQAVVNRSLPVEQVLDTLGSVRP